MEENTSLAELKFVSSDCKPLSEGFSFQVCADCGHVQKLMDFRWQEATAEIYRNYDLYDLSDGIEQAIFSSTGEANTRSARILAQLQQVLDFSGAGKMLDVGCGVGALLRTFAEVSSGWDLHGFEIGDRFRSRVESIDRVRDFYTGDVSSIDKSFDLITLVHVLEHVPDPAGILIDLKTKLCSNGRIFVQVPNLTDNPFDLLVADHVSHFTPQVLTQLAEKCGYHVELVATDWVSKEISLLLSVPSSPAESKCKTAQPNPATANRCQTDWLLEVVRDARSHSEGGALSVFGTAIAGTWLAANLERVAFFVDEDTSRTGKTHVGCTIIQPNSISAGSKVYMALPAAIASSISARLQKQVNACEFILPPPRAENV